MFQKSSSYEREPNGKAPSPPTAVMGPPRVLPSCNHTTSESDSKKQKTKGKIKKSKQTKALQMKKQKNIGKKQKNKKPKFPGPWLR